MTTALKNLLETSSKHESKSAGTGTWYVKNANTTEALDVSTLEVEIVNSATKERRTLSAELPDVLADFVGYYDNVYLRSMSTDVVHGGPSSKQQTILISAVVTTENDGEQAEDTEVSLQIDIDPKTGEWDAEDQKWED